MTDLRGFLDNYSTTLNGVITAVATTITVTSATGLQAVLDDGADYITLTLDDGAGNVEIVYCTSISGSVLTVSRGEEGTTGFAFADASTVECRLSSAGVRESSGWRVVEVRDLASGAATVDFDLLEVGTYKIEIDNFVCQTSTADLEILQGTGGTPTFQTTTYYWSGTNETWSATASNRGNNQTEGAIVKNLTANTAERGMLELIIANPSISSKHAMAYRFTQQTREVTGTLVRDVTEVMTAIRFQMSTGNIQADTRFIVSIRAN